MRSGLKSELYRVLALFLTVILFPFAAWAEGLRGYDAKEGYQYIALGNWTQGENGEKQPIIWRVLTVNETEALLLSEYVLGNRRVHPDDNEYVAFKGVWNLTDMYDFLNGTFLPEAFTQEEVPLLLVCEELGTVFLPSGEELSNKEYGFINNKARMGKGTPYALANGLFKYSTKFSPYWTRSQSTTKNFGARCTKVKGNLGYIRVVVENLGWRPACRLDLSTAQIVSGEGTLEKPFTLSYQQSPGDKP